MIKISNIRMKPGYTWEELADSLQKKYRLSEEDVKTVHLLKESIDARKKPEIVMNLSVSVLLKDEARFLSRYKKDAVPYEEKRIPFITCKDEQNKHPIIIGAGPAGLFCAYYLAEYGYEPILLERGKPADERKKDVEAFWETGTLNPESNVLFGEGGAGTFSDGKLNCSNKDPYGYQKQVFQTFFDNGAEANVLYDAKPHIGTDALIGIVTNMRKHIMANGGCVYFEKQVTELLFRDATGSEENNADRIVSGVKTKDGDVFHGPFVVLATGHSARDTFRMLSDRDVLMEAKPFAVGYRVQHRQEDVSCMQYGERYMDVLPPADYKAVAHAENGRNVFSFCMCPGGYVVNASSEEDCLCVNGMSYQKRDGENANAAIVMSVDPSDYPGDSPLSGIDFQRTIEKKAFQAANGNVPIQTFGDYKENKASEASSFSRIRPMIKGAYAPSNLRGILPEELEEAFLDGMAEFAKKLPVFADDEAILAGIEARTSSPVRILRNEDYQAIHIRNFFPCGEGAGYAGGITSAAVDGLKIACKIMESQVGI
ncbi:MAG: NAD(P)-binding protein [Lachnospiraceae bacterium]|nr:NAD(P)-binding protein [Lachnospiraceae bacterium]